MQEENHVEPADFRSVLEQHAHSRRFISMQISSGELCRTVFSYENLPGGPDTLKQFLSLYAASASTCSVPFEFSFDPMDCFLMLHTRTGGGRVKNAGQTVEVTAGNTALLSCREAFRLSSFLLPWEFEVFWIRPEGLSGYQSFLKDGIRSFAAEKYSPLPSKLRELCIFRPRVIGYELLTMHRLLTDVLCEMTASQKTQRGDGPQKPGYLSALKEDLDRNFQAPFSLEKYENRFGISHYRLCREFSAAYGVPPMRYLKTVRIEKAKAMLLSTDRTVSEISMAVGYENVNNFIIHFKALTGMTPGAYRRNGQM